MHVPSLGIRQRLVLLGLIPAAIVLGCVAWLTTRQVHALLRDAAGRTLAAQATAIAAELDRGAFELTTVARTLATAVGRQPAGEAAAIERVAEELVGASPSLHAVTLVEWTDTAGDDGQRPRAVGVRFARSAVDPTRVNRTETDAASLPAGSSGGRPPATPRRDAIWAGAPYAVDGIPVVGYEHPVERDGRYRGAIVVERSVADLGHQLQRLRERRLGRGAVGDAYVIAADGRLLAGTAPDDAIDGSEAAAAPLRALVEAATVAGEGGSAVRAAEPLRGGACLAAAAAVPTSGWTVVTTMSEGSLWSADDGGLVRLAAVSALLLGSLLALLGWLATRFTRRIDRATAIARRVAAGDLTGRLDARGGDESGQLLRDVSRMTGSLRALVGDVKRAGSELDATARSLSAAGERQEQAIDSLGSSTNQAAVASRQIAVTGTELLGTMNEVATVAAETAQVASAGRADLAGIGETMARLEQSTADFTERLAVIRQRAEDINMVITTITKVADQTNLLSINAAIEAEKAGEYGQGFIVVAREIRRLADQTAVATLDIERLVAQMHEAVSAGVGEMDRFATDVKTGVDRVSGISGQFVEVIDKVHGLSTRFEHVNQGMHAQATGARQINEALLTLSEGTRSAGATLQQFQEAARQMVTAVEGLTGAVSRFRLDAPEPSAGMDGRSTPRR
ncbi:MAG: methyl-accepting chemotaxis protein [Planctomycetaceae bacterium]